MRHAHRSRPRPARARGVGPRAVAAPALIAAGLLVAGCAAGDSDDPVDQPAPATVTVTESPQGVDASESAPSASPSSASPSSATPTAAPSSATPTGSSATGTTEVTAAERERLDVLEALLLTPQDAPGVLTDRETEQGGGEEVSTSLTLTGVTPMGECRELIERINTQTADAVGGTVATYTVDGEAMSGFVTDQSGAFAMAVLTRADADILAPFGELPATCGTVAEAEGGPRAEFTPVPGVPDAAQVQMSLGEGGEALFTMVVGGASDGREHVYMGFVGVDPELAADTLRDQVEAFEARSR